MSSYNDFSRCVICRTKKNLEDYKGDFEVTMILNTLYLSLMYILEKRDKLHIKTSKIIPFLQEKGIVNTHKNSFNNDDIARFLRNSLAHFNIEISNDSYGKRIEHIRLWGKNLPKKPKCKTPCSEPKCIPIQYKSDKSEAVCTFVFDVKQLREYVEMVIDVALDEEYAGCETCKYHRKIG